MKPGHEDCGHDIERISVWGGGGSEKVECHHDHDEPITASDALGDGPIVAWYCECCGRIGQDSDYLNGVQA